MESSRPGVKKAFLWVVAKLTQRNEKLEDMEVGIMKRGHTTEWSTPRRSLAQTAELHIHPTVVSLSPKYVFLLPELNVT